MDEAMEEQWKKYISSVTLKEDVELFKVHGTNLYVDNDWRYCPDKCTEDEDDYPHGDVTMKFIIYYAGEYPCERYLCTMCGYRKLKNLYDRKYPPTSMVYIWNEYIGGFQRTAFEYYHLLFDVDRVQQMESVAELHRLRQEKREREMVNK